MPDRPAPLTARDRLTGLVQPDETDRLSILVYGGPGVGKTVLAGTAQDEPSTRPVVVCSAEGGHRSIMHRLRIPDTDPRHDTLFIKLIETFPDDMLEIVDVVRDNPGMIKTVVIDSLTDMAWRVEQSILSRPNPKRESPHSLAWSEWGPFNTRVRNLVTVFRDLKVNVIATALENRDDKGNFTPIIGGNKTSAVIPGFFDTVARLSTEGEIAADGKTLVSRRVLTIMSNPKFAAKDRNDPTGVLAPTLYDPTVSKLVARFAEGMQAAVKSMTLPASNGHKEK